MLHFTFTTYRAVVVIESFSQKFEFFFQSLLPKIVIGEFIYLGTFCEFGMSTHFRKKENQTSMKTLLEVVVLDGVT